MKAAEGGRAPIDPCRIPDEVLHLQGSRHLLSSSVSTLTTLRMPMAATPPTDPKPAGDDRNLVPVEATPVFSFEDKLYVFWQKYRGLILGLCVLVLVGIVGKGVWDYLARQKELDVQKSYAAAATPEQLKTFSASHTDHVLGGVAQLRIADEAYAAGKSAEAVAAYHKAISSLREGPLAARARLGRALAKIQAGNAAEAINELKQLVNDTAQFKAIRTEAAYHLTSLAVENGNVEEAQKLSDQLMQIDPTSPWTQRGLQLRATLPATPAPAPTVAPAASDALPAITVPKK